MSYQPVAPFCTRFLADGEESPNVGMAYLGRLRGGHLGQLRTRVRAEAKDPRTAPGVYVIEDNNGVPCAAFDAWDQVATKRIDTPPRDIGKGTYSTGGHRYVDDHDAPPVRFVKGSNLSWGR